MQTPVLLKRLRGMNFESLRMLQAALARADDILREAVSRARSTGSDPTDALRGLVITDDDVAKELTRTPLSGLWAEGDLIARDAHEVPDDTPLYDLALIFGLSALDLDILLMSLAPELDRRYERLYGYLQDDVSLRRMTVNLAMNLLGATLEQRFAVWQRLIPGAPLRRFGLIDVQADNTRPNSPVLAAHLRVDSRIVGFVLGENTPDERVKRAVTSIQDDMPEICVPDDVIEPIRSALNAGECPMMLFIGLDEVAKRQTAAALCQDSGLPLLHLDAAALAALEPNLPLSVGWRLALREAYLSRAALVVSGWKHLLDEQENARGDVWTSLREYGLPVFISALETWEPRELVRDRRLLRVKFDIPDYPARRTYLQRLLDDHRVPLDASAADEISTKYRFTRAQMARVVQTALDFAVTHGRPVALQDLYAAAHAHSSLRLGHLAKRVEPRYGWDDLILPPDQLQQLREMTDRARQAYRVHEEWGFGRKVAPNQGVSALFAGESGTGKTMSAEVIARELGLVMYQIDLSAVVSKYIGETEKNLSVIFAEAQSSNAILFFDEADALFGKRSEVKDAHDRYANIETAYLLQQIDNYDGIAILATNLRQNLDEAFTRRLDFVVDFPFPDVEYRTRLWAAHFPDEAPLSSEVNLGELAERYRLSGGNIRNAALASAYLAAGDGGVITMRHVRQAVRREHQKMGRLLDNLN
jgi:hypothetical protein